MTHDAIEHPTHYTWLPGIECLDVTENFSFNLGNVIKYVWRAGRKNSTAEDLRKARFYLDREIARVTDERTTLRDVARKNWSGG